MTYGQALPPAPSWTITPSLLTMEPLPVLTTPGITEPYAPTKMPSWVWLVAAVAAYLLFFKDKR